LSAAAVRANFQRPRTVGAGFAMRPVHENRWTRPGGGAWTAGG